ncbi:MAG: beta-propeller fold lactonase family protein [Gemmatimonadota bacterium]
MTRTHRRPTTLLAVSFIAISYIALPLAAQDHAVRIIQTNAAGDNVHLIDPSTNEVVGVIHGISRAHGVTSSPDGRTLYFSNEVDATLDVVPMSTLAVAKQIPLSNRPNNIAITPDGSKLYVAIVAEGLVDVIDTAEGRVVKSIRTLGGVHNVFITPDGKYIAAGMIGARTLTIIDTGTDEAVWSLHFGGRSTGGYPDGGVRPLAFDTYPDGSTKRIFVQLSNFHGVVVVDFATRSIVDQIQMPTLPLTRQSNDALQGSPGHGLAVSPDGTQLWSTSKPNDHVYAWSLPDLEFLGGVGVGHHPDWLTMTPDGRFLYAANAGSNDVSVVDTRTFEEIARIDVGQTPKRNHTVVIR